MLRKVFVLALMILPSLAAGQSVSFVDAEGNATATYLESSTVYLRVDDAAANLDPGTAETVQVQLTSLLAGDAEILTLTETGNATGVFEGQVELDLELGTAQNGIFETYEDAGPPHAFDTLTASYGPASANATTLGSRSWLIDAEGAVTSTYATGSTVYVRVEDHNFNNPYSDYLYVELSASGGDMVSTFIFETGADTALFEGSVELEHTTILDTYDDKLQAVTGEQVQLSHLDYWGYSSSTATATLIVGELNFVDPAGEPTAQLFEGGDARLRLFSAGDNANPLIIETVTASLSSQYAGDAENLVLTETGDDTGIFEGTIELANDGAVPANGVLETGDSGWPDFLPDQVNAQAVTLAATATTVPSATFFLDAWGRETEAFAAGDVAYLRVIDHHLDDPLLIDTAAVTVDALGSGDSEYFMLTETGQSTGTFEGSLALGSGGFPGDGTLDTAVGETIEASHAHTLIPGSSTDQATIAGSQTWFVDAEGQPAAVSMRGLPVTVRVIDHGANADPFATETTSVELDSQLSGDLETLTLTETGPDTGVFEGSLLTRFDSVTAGNGILETWGNPGPPVVNDTLSANYTDAFGQSGATVESLGARISFVDAAGEPVASYATGSTAYLRLEAHDADDPGLVDTATVWIDDFDTGDFEELVLTETGLDAGIFEGSIGLEDSAVSVYANALLETQAGHELVATYSDVAYVEARAVAGIVFGSIELTDGAGTPAVELFEGGVFGVRVFSAGDNLDPGSADSLQVALDTLYGGDAETLLLVETGADTNVFEGTMSLVFAAAGPTLGDGVLETTAGAPDVITASYLGLADTATAVASRTTLVDAGGQEVEIFEVDSVAYVRVVDLSLNDPQAIDLAQATVSATVYGDSETVSLTETGLDTGVFEGSVDLGISYSIGDGILEVSHNEIMEAVHYHHMGAGSSSDQALGKLRPGVSIMQPADQATFLSSDSIFFFGHAQDLDEGELTASLTWTSDLDGAIGSGESFSTNLSIGTHVITASVTNSTGLTGSESVTIQVDNTPPAAGITAPADGAAVNAGDPLLFTGSASDYDDGDLTASLSWSSDLDGAIGSGGSFSISTLSAGTHVIIASVIDSGGAVASDTVNLTVNAAPNVTITAPADGAGFNVGDNVSFTGSANDAEDGDLTAGIAWTSDLDGSLGNGGSVSTVALSAGTHVITALVTDANGLQDSDAITITVNSAPSVNISAPADGSGFNAGDSVTFNGSANDAEDGDLTASITWTSDLDGAIGTGGSFATVALSAGTHVITASVTDAAGLQDSDAITITVNAAPSATITAPADGSTFLATDSISFAGSASDPEDGDLTAALAWTSDLDGAIGTGGSFTASLSVGTHTITASVTDAGGLSGSDAITVTVDNTAPSVTISAPADGAGFNVGDSVSFTGSATDFEDGDLTASLTWTSSLDGAIGSGGSFATSGLSAGTHVITASVTDAGGLQGSDAITITVNAAPIVTITAPTDGSSYTQGDSIGFAGTASDPEQGDLSASLAWSSSLDGAIGTGGSFSTSALSIGTHTITASVVDAGGLPGTDAITVTVQAPPVQVTFTSIADEDGWVRESSESSNVGGARNTTGAGKSALRPGDHKNDRQYKAIVSFDTSSLPDGATIVSATLRMRRGKLTGTNPFTTHGSCWVDVQTGGFSGSTALQNSDFEAAATAVQSATLSSPAANGDWSEGSLDAAGRSAIDTTGTTQMRIYFDLDDNDDGGNDYMGYYSANNSSSSNHPQLVVVYQQ